MKTIFILSDALRHDYLNRMPFLKSLSEKNIYVKNISPGIGFCEITEYLTGMNTFESKNVFQLTFTGKFESPSISKGATKLNKKIMQLPRGQWKYYNWLSKYYLAKRIPPEMLRVRYQIPLNLIKFFKPTESKYTYDSEQFFGEHNLLREISKSGYTYDINDFVEFNKITGSDDERFSRLCEKVKHGRLKDFTLVYIGYGEIAHYHGTNGEYFNQILKKYDRDLEFLYSLINNYSEPVSLMILGDHGMVDVDTYIDIETKLNEIISTEKLVLGKDIVFFIDSTCVRIWVRQKEKITIIEKHLQKFLHKNLEDFTFPSDIKELYGDIILMLKPGKVFYPDFFNLHHVVGMHGYNTKVSEQKGMMIVYNGTTDKIKLDNLDLKDVKNLILSEIKKQL